MSDISEILNNSQLLKLLEDFSGQKLLEILLAQIAQLSHNLGVANQAAHEANISKTNFANTLNQLVYQLKRQTERCDELERSLVLLREENQQLRDQLDAS